jgi:hypothetical protein
MPLCDTELVKSANCCGQDFSAKGSVMHPLSLAGKGNSFNQRASHGGIVPVPKFSDASSPVQDAPQQSKKTGAGKKVLSGPSANRDNVLRNSLCRMGFRQPPHGKPAQKECPEASEDYRSDDSCLRSLEEACSSDDSLRPDDAEWLGAIGDCKAELKILDKELAWNRQELLDVQKSMVDADFGRHAAFQGAHREELQFQNLKYEVSKAIYQDKCALLMHLNASTLSHSMSMVAHRNDQLLARLAQGMDEKLTRLDKS